MQHFTGNLINNLDLFDAVCITTNGTVRNDGACVMGRGIALTFKNLCPRLPYTLGAYIQKYGNRCFLLSTYKNVKLLSYVVKHNWWENADPALIVKSANELMLMADKFKLNKIALPRPGCGNGKLNWEDVEPLIAPILDDRFIICSFK